VVFAHPAVERNRDGVSGHVDDYLA
jgi:hypothetical protein